MTSVAVGRTFDSLRVRNFRLYFFGQMASVTGMWMQLVAEAWVVLQLTDNGVAVGVVTLCQYLPLLIGAPFVGGVIDRVPRRRLLLVTQGLMLLIAATLWVITASGALTVPVLYVLAAAFGLVQPFDNPARRVFVYEMVGRDRVTNAVALNSALITFGRIVGPAAGGFILGGGGASWCFAINTVSYVAILAALLAMRVDELEPSAAPAPDGTAAADGFRYVRRTPEVLWPLVLTGTASIFLLNYPVVLPLLAERTFDAGAGTFGAMYAVMSVGSVIGALGLAAHARTSLRLLLRASAGFGVVVMAVALAPSLAVAFGLLLLLGVADQSFCSTASALLQAVSQPEYRGRVLAFFSALFIGAQSLSGLLAGGVSELVGPRSTLAVGAVALLLMAGLAHRHASTAEGAS